MDPKRNGNSAAYARPASVDPTNGTLSDGDWVEQEQVGLTKREAFAMAAMQGLTANPEWAYNDTTNVRGLARDAVQIADALLDELAKERP